MGKKGEMVMNIYLYPSPNKNSRFFDEFYSALLAKNDEQIKVRILEPQSKLGRKLFFVVNRLGNHFSIFSRLIPIAINSLLKKDRGGGSSLYHTACCATMHKKSIYFYLS